MRILGLMLGSALEMYGHVINHRHAINRIISIFINLKLVFFILKQFNILSLFIKWTLESRLTPMNEISAFRRLFP